MAKRIKIGDIVEIQTSKGLAYAQFTHQHKQMGSLLRILSSFFKARPAKFDELVQQKESFVNFFPLQAAINRQIFEIAGNCPVPEPASKFPLFRAEGWRDKSGKVLSWWLWDGQKSWQVERLTDELRRLPIQSVCNDTLLIARIEEGWTPETDKWSQE